VFSWVLLLALPCNGRPGRIAGVVVLVVFTAALCLGLPTWVCGRAGRFQNKAILLNITTTEQYQFL